MLIFLFEKFYDKTYRIKRYARNLFDCKYFLSFNNYNK